MNLLLIATLVALLVAWYVMGQRRRRAAREAADLEARLRSRRANRVPVVSSNLRGSAPESTQSAATAARDARTDRSA
jgi:hypothetical protein